jgi:N-acylneuraminate cytidylyltransferase
LEKVGFRYDAVILLQPTSPFREKGLIIKAAQKFIESRADSLITVRMVPHQYNPHWVFEQNNEGYLEIATSDKTLISRRQDLPEAYFRDGQVYITSVNLIKNSNTFVGERLSFWVNNYSGSEINIDNLSDWDKAEIFLERHNTLSNE